MKFNDLFKKASNNSLAMDDARKLTDLVKVCAESKGAVINNQAFREYLQSTGCGIDR